MAANGTIVTRVYTARAQIPIQGATVAITQKNPTNRNTLLAARVTDENGRTTPVRVLTPDPDASFYPGGEIPFSLCDIWVEALGFEMLIVQDVQIFPNTETLQELELVPLPEQAPPQARAELIQITPQEL